MEGQRAMEGKHGARGLSEARCTGPRRVALEDHGRLGVTMYRGESEGDGAVEEEIRTKQ